MKLRLPVETENKRSVEVNEKTEIAIVPDSNREGQEHDTNHKDIGDAIQKNHSVNQGVLLKCLQLFNYKSFFSTNVLTL